MITISYWTDLKAPALCKPPSKNYQINNWVITWGDLARFQLVCGMIWNVIVCEIPAVWMSRVDIDPAGAKFLEMVVNINKYGYTGW